MANTDIRSILRLGGAKPKSPLHGSRLVYHGGDTGPSVFLETQDSDGAPVNLADHYAAATAVYCRDGWETVSKPIAMEAGPPPGITVPAPPTDAATPLGIVVRVQLRFVTPDGDVHTVPEELEWAVRGCTSGAPVPPPGVTGAGVPGALVTWVDTHSVSTAIAGVDYLSPTSPIDAAKLTGTASINTTGNAATANHAAHAGSADVAASTEGALTAGDGISMGGAFDGSTDRTMSVDIGTGAGQVAAGDHDHDGVYEQSIPAGTTAQFYRGDKTWASLNKASVGLSNVDNTSDAAKPISSATQAALDTKAAATHNHAGVYEPANANIQAHISSTSNPHGTTAAQVGAPTTTGAGASGTWGINVTGNAATASSVPWSGVTGRPTTVAGYGITDALTGTVGIANGGTGATTAAAARTNLGAAGLGANTFTGVQTIGRPGQTVTIDKGTASSIETFILSDAWIMRNNRASGGAFGRNIMEFQNGNGDRYFAIGAFGNVQQVDYGYIGAASNNATVTFSTVNTTDGVNRVGINLSALSRPTTTLDVNGTIRATGLRLVATPPATSSSTGTAGDIAADADYFYVCVGANTWKRTALSTW